jgi:tetratricopeptide (TPR) repeat protein
MYSASQLLENNPDKAMEIYGKVIENIPTPYLLDFQTRFFMSGLPYLTKWDREQASRFVYLGLATLQIEADKEKPKISSLLYQAEIARQAAYALDNKYFLKEAEKILERAHLVSPKRQQVIFLLATVKTELDNPEQAYRLVQEGIEMTPIALQGWLRLIWVYKMNNDQEGAQRVLQKAKDTGVAFTLEDLETVKRILSPECCKRGEIF